MSEEKNVIPYKIQKGNRPKIEEVISYCLDSKLKDMALDFAAYMREMKMPFKTWSSSTRAQIAKSNGYMICHIHVHRQGDPRNDIPPEMPSFFQLTPSFHNTDKYEHLIKNEKLTNVQWESSVCTECNPKHNHYVNGRNLTVLSDELNDLCPWWGLKIKNPDNEIIPTIKRLLELEKMARDGLF